MSFDKELQDILLWKKEDIRVHTFKSVYIKMQKSYKGKKMICFTNYTTFCVEGIVR